MPLGSDNVVKKKRTRASRPKVRTGCITCKIRHKKCDETRPYCLRCTSTGRKCDGYQPLPLPRTRSRKGGDATVSAPAAVVGSSSLLLPSDSPYTLQHLHSSTVAGFHAIPTNNWYLTDRERGYLDFFRNHTAVQCAGYFHDDFWCRLVPQASEVEPAIRHAAIALGALHRNFESLAVDEKLRDDAFPLQQCNKAIALLRNQLGSGSRHMETTLITCILLISFAFLQGDAATATSHYHVGVRLLREWQQTGMLGSSRSGSSMASTLVKLFARMELYLSTFANLDDDDVFVVVAADEEPVRSRLESIDIPAQIDSLDQASSLLFSLIGRAMQNEQRRMCQSAVACQLRERIRADVSCKLQQWNRKLNTFLEHHALSLSAKDTRTVIVLQLWSETVYIMNAAHDRQSEMQFDAFEQRFHRVVRLAEALLDPCGLAGDVRTAAAMPTFSVETGVIPPLFYCSYKCRNWSIRRVALSLLRRWQRQEGIWQTPDTAVVLERLIAIESEGLSPGEPVPEEARILIAQVKVIPSSPNIRLRYCRSVDPDGTKHWETEWLSRR
ncbi:hypothetical protein VTN77DRAFT_1932 [Rasamsonia byssochlamydoides]|uniref:uncharacterized protein n=1 Tax=Rasamsonia byssochlamydoides TaxID=89139 RepID=UPI003743121B